MKHGDLSSVLFAPDRNVDVHMAKNGLNFACGTCHVSNQHVVAGSRYNVAAHDTVGTGKPGARRDVATCESCHGVAPHKTMSLSGMKLNDHVDRVACQTCHIPEFARGGSFVAHVKPMITGFDKVDLTPEEEAYLKSDEPGRLCP